MTKLQRTFHPVGFGAFYTEQHTQNGKNAIIVYDCGSRTKGVDLESYIKGLKFSPKVIDILFISHFHADHINGIPFLKKYFTIKKVVIPYIPEEE